MYKKQPRALELVGLESGEPAVNLRRTLYRDACAYSYWWFLDQGAQRYSSEQEICNTHIS